MALRRALLFALTAGCGGAPIDDTTGTTAGAGATTGDAATMTATAASGDPSTSSMTDVDPTTVDPTTSEPTTDAPSPDLPDATDGAPSCARRPSVQFVYFVEADAAFDPDARDRIEAFALDFQQYWYEQLGATFLLGDPIVEVIDAEHDALWYVETPDGIHDDARWFRLGNIKTEVYAALGLVDFDPSRRVVNYPTTRHDGRVGANFGGAWMDGDDLDCMAAQGGVTYPFDEQGPAHCMGHVAHEFGHVLGLDHTGPEEDCMQVGFYNTVNGDGMCSFSEENVAAILADPDNAGWLDALPGEACTSDG